MKLIKMLQAVMVCSGLIAVGGANAALVSCGNATLGVRLAVVDPGLVDGYCYAQNGNLQDADISALGLFQIEKDASGAPLDFGLGLLRSTGSTSGDWTINASVWNLWDRIFLGFHFGGAGDKDVTNPDSFIVELARPDATGTWELTGDKAQLTGLSNMYLLRGADACQSNCGSLRLNVVTEPALPLLMGVGLLGFYWARRRN